MTEISLFNKEGNQKLKELREALYEERLNPEDLLNEFPRLRTLLWSYDPVQIETADFQLQFENFKLFAEVLDLFLCVVERRPLEPRSSADYGEIARKLLNKDTNTFLVLGKRFEKAISDLRSQFEQ